MLAAMAPPPTCAGDKDVAQVDMVTPAPKPVPPTNPVARFGEKLFHVHSRGSTWLGELRWVVPSCIPVAACQDRQCA